MLQIFGPVHMWPSFGRFGRIDDVILKGEVCTYLPTHLDEAMFLLIGFFRDATTRTTGKSNPVAYHWPNGYQVTLGHWNRIPKILG